MHRLTIDRLIRVGYLHPVHRGVYLVGHPVPVPGAREMAAALACGPNAFVSHRDAAALHELLPYPAQPGPVHITVAGDRSHPGISVHRVKSLPRDEIGKLRGIPVTSPMRTLIDLAAAGDRDLEQALAVARAKRLVKAEDIVRRARGRPGAQLLRRVLDRGPALTRSEAERKLLRLVRDAALPRPETNARLNGFEIDFLWRDHRLVVEVDGFAFHGDRSAFERDRERDAVLTAAGYRVVRVTWRQLLEQQEAIIARTAAALATR